MAGMLKFVSCIFAPFVWILTKSTNGLLRLFHINPDEQDDSVTEEEIRMMLDTGSEKGTIDKIENEMIQMYLSLMTSLFPKFVRIGVTLLSNIRRILLKSGERPSTKSAIVIIQSAERIQTM